MTTDMDDGGVNELKGELLEAQRQIVELQARTKTTLTGAQFLTIVLIGPLF